MSVGGMSVGEMSSRGYVRSGNCPSGKCPSGKCLSGKCPSGKCPSGKCLSGKCPDTVVRTMQLSKAVFELFLVVPIIYLFGEFSYFCLIRINKAILTKNVCLEDYSRKIRGSTIPNR